MKRLLRSVFLVGLLAGLAVPAVRAQSSITSQLDPSEIEAGGTSVLTLSISDAISARVSVPRVDGLSIIYAGQRSQFSMVNGQTSRQLNVYYHVRGLRPGDYIIPSISVYGGAQQVSSAPIHLHVAGGAGSSTLVAPLPSQSRQQPAMDSEPAAPEPSDESTAGSAQSESVFLRLVSPKKAAYYVGEIVPVKIKLFVRGDQPARLRSLPLLVGDAFTMNKLPREPFQKMESIDGIPYQTATWNTALSAVKSGEFPVAVQIELTTIERQRAPHGGIFDDPFFAMLASSVKQVDKTVANPEESWKVLPLPSDGKPLSFSGAIGDFKCTAQAEPLQVAAGDPVTLQFTVEGQGNFSRVNAPVLQNVDGWKTYPASGKAEPADDYGYTGKKIFEQAVIPQRTGLGMPKGIFSWFNPEARQYVTREVTPPQVAITDAPPGSVAAHANPALHKLAADDEPKREGDSLVANKVDPGAFSASLQSQLLNPWLLTTQAASLALLFAGYLTARRRHLLASNPEYAYAVRLDRRLREALDAMHRAAAAGDAAAFFNHARLALQLRLGTQWKIKPENITYPLIEQRAPALARSLEAIFLTADELSYSGLSGSHHNLAELEQTVRVELENIGHL